MTLMKSKGDEVRDAAITYCNHTAQLYANAHGERGSVEWAQAYATRLSEIIGALADLSEEAWPGPHGEFIDSSSIPPAMRGSPAKIPLPTADL